MPPAEKVFYLDKVAPFLEDSRDMAIVTDRPILNNQAFHCHRYQKSKVAFLIILAKQRLMIAAIIGLGVVSNNSLIDIPLKSYRPLSKSARFHSR
ncbi:hypothetical protein [Geotalea uraniireducens]|uniref:hypothetical protein n=1 Tax=Geotalea uraniireducens TaxID=351604 RepID=UPI00249220A8|nr:hypothetical protein [Geotalea uraniireducens]